MKLVKKNEPVLASRRNVLASKCGKTKGGLTAFDLTRNKKGCIVSKRRQAQAKGSNLQPWVAAVRKAKAELCLTGWQPIRKNTPLYAKARQIYEVGDEPVA